MICLIRAEALRLTTTRTYWLLAAGAIALIAGGVAPTAAATSFTAGTSPARPVLAIAGLAQTVALIAGALSVTGEFRHKTITPAVLITPRRTPLLAAKAHHLGRRRAGLRPGRDRDGHRHHLAAAGRPAHPRRSLRRRRRRHHRRGGPSPPRCAPPSASGSARIIRNQAGAITAVLALLYIAEPLLGFIPHLGSAIQQYGLGGLAAAATQHRGLPRQRPPPRASQRPRLSWPATPPRPCSPAPRCCAAATSSPDCAWPGRPRGPAA